MQQTCSLQNKSYSRLPQFAARAKKIAILLDNAFGRLFRWQFNPFAQSGVVAVSLFFILLVTGLILIFFYRLGTPYESMVEIQNNIWFAGWLRSVHRYATDLGFVFIFFHVLRLLLQGKTWGPRTLAWVSGVFMLGLYFVSALTGYILVWDDFGLKVARAWASLIDTIPVLPAPLSRAFSGDVTLATSFFFMNLFLHVAIPLGIVAALWLHTSKLTKPKWIAPKKVMIFICVSMIVFSLAMPAPLNSKANLLKVNSVIKEDLWFSWWILLKDFVGNLGMLLIVVVCGLAMILVPWFWKPKFEEAPQPSIHDEASCEGCTQCVKDCPFDAISMVPRTIGTGSEMVANVSARDCVSCGICAGSCSQFAIGPAGRSGRDQLTQVKSIFNIDTAMKTPVLMCKNRMNKETNEENSENYLTGKYLVSEVDCVGSVHPGVMTLLLGNHSKVVLAGCEPGCCEMRLGSEIEWERIYDDREPALPARVNKSQIVWDQKKPENSWSAWAKIGFSTTLGLLILGIVSAVNIGSEGKGSFLRLAWRFPIQKKETCVEVSDLELKKRPIHMQVKKNCTTEVLPVVLQVHVDGVEVIHKNIVPAGLKEDRPLLVEEQVEVSEGKHTVKISMVSQGANISGEFSEDFEKGMARLLTIVPSPNNADERIFKIK